MNLSTGRMVRLELSRATARLPLIGSRLAIRLHRRGLGAAEITWPELVELAERERPSIVSVDVFDTCLVRDLLGDEPIELAIGRRNDIRCSDGTSALPSSKTRTAAEFEELLCRPVPGVAEALARIRGAGASIAFLSDTERASTTLRTILTEAGIFVEGDDLRASCEEGATKSSGELFTKVWPDPGVRSELWHIGDNLWSDVTMAHQSGIRAFAVAGGEPSRYESAMAKRPRTAGPAVAAAARLARLHVAESATRSERANILEQIGSQVAGQAFGAFLLWVAEVSREEDLGHLSFLSRDGELFLEMARVMPADHWGERTLGYLHCSRWSWVLAGAVDYGIDHWLETGTKDEAAFIHANRHNVPLASLLGRIGLTVNDVGSHRTLAELDPQLPLPEAAVDDWRLLLDDPAIADLILSRAVERRSVLIDYLGGLSLPRAPVGLVDVGWRGRLAWSMSPIIREVTGHEPVHLHVGGTSVLQDAERAVDIRRFAFDGRQPAVPISNPVSCVETITASGRPRIVRYERMSDGSVAPRLERGVDAIQNKDRQHLWAGALQTAARLPSRALLEQLGCSTVSLGEEAKQVLALWWTEPVWVEADAMRGLSFEADDDGRLIGPVLAPYQLTELAPARRNKRQWRQGSEVVSPVPIGRMARVYRWARDQLELISDRS